MNELDGQVAVVTGAGRGMGRAIALELARAGARVMAAARTESELEQTVAAADAGTVLAQRTDVANPEDVSTLMARAVDDLGTIDMLVCSHGIYQGGTGALDLALEQYERTMRVNVTGALLCAQHAGRAMRDAQRPGRIVFISSGNGQLSQAGAVDYDTSKAALNGLTRALAIELAPYDITVNAVAPGWIRTAMSEEELEHLERAGLVMNPLGQVGEPGDVARTVRWLVDPRTRFVTGSIVNVDGGQTAMLAKPWSPNEASIV
jgi:3-oxoacyl-[acyl-carrier protein] reductase